MNYDFNQEISQVFAETRKESEMTQVELGRLIGMSQANVCKIENGAKMSASDWIKFCVVFDYQDLFNKVLCVRDAR